MVSNASQEGASRLLSAQEVHINGLKGLESLQFKAAYFDQIMLACGPTLGRVARELGPNFLKMTPKEVWEYIELSSPAIWFKETGIRQSPPPPSTQEVIDKFLAAKRAANRSGETIRSYKNALRPFARAYPVLPTKPEQIEEYLAPHRGETSTAKDIYIVLNIFYRFANARFGVPNPLAQIDKPRAKIKTPDHLTVNQAQALLSAIETDRERGLIYCLFGLGLRLGEACRLKIADIGADTILIHGKERDEEMPLPAEIRDVLAQLTEGRSPGEAVFQGRQGPLSHSRIQDMVKGLFARAGITGVRSSPHTLRHSKGVLSTMFGLDQFSNKRLLRHTSTQMTDRYNALNLEELRVKDKEFNPLLRILGQLELGIKPDYAQLVTPQDAAQLLPQLLDGMISLGQIAHELSQALGGNGHRPEQLKEIIRTLEHQAGK